MIKKIIAQLMDKKDLSQEQARDMMQEIMDGKVSDAQIASLLTVLRYKGESIDEITGCAEVMRSKCDGINPKGDVMEIVGTGGDGASTFNISTVSAFCIASAGVKVAKHGNRGVSSKSGSSDVLQELGVKIDIDKAKSEEILEKINMCFLYAPVYHKSMKYVAPARAELGVRTIFNILGPLANPAKATHQLLGVFEEELILPMANVLKKLGIKRAMVVHGSDGLDEITLTGDTKVSEVQENGEINSYVISPQKLGFTLCKKEDLVGGDPKENAKITREILSGKKGAKRDVVVLNSAMCLYMASNNLTVDECIKKITGVIDSGKALKTLDEFVALTNS